MSKEWKDEKNGLAWCTDEFELMNWEEAIKFANSYDNGKWRLPTIKELLTLVDYSRQDPSINTNIFKDCKSSYYWSASPNAYSSYGAWSVYFYGGYSSSNYKNLSLYVRLVRDSNAEKEVTPAPILYGVISKGHSIPCQVHHSLTRAKKINSDREGTKIFKYILTKEIITK